MLPIITVKKLKRIGFIAFLIVLGLGSLLPSNAFGQKQNRADECNAQCQQDLAKTAAATARYHQEESALADGFITTQECLSVPNLGAMGVHYINPVRAMDLDVNANEPELLLYEPTKNGRMRLVGVEYFVPVLVNGQLWFGNEAPTTVDNAAPQLFGQTFDGPMAGHEPGMPWHYDLHVWVWRNNPSGLFAQFNPKVQCQQSLQE
jgi:hypothetical protein